MNHLYSITIKVNAIKILETLLPSELDIYLKHVLNRTASLYLGEPVHFEYEIDPHGRRHLHGTFKCPRKSIRKSLSTMAGVHIHLVYIKDQTNLEYWTNYYQKDQEGSTKLHLQSIDDGNYEFI